MRAVVTSPYRRAVIGASTSPRLAISTSTLLRGHLERELDAERRSRRCPVNSTWVSAVARQYGSGASHSRSNGAIALVPAGRSTCALRGSARSSSGWRPSRVTRRRPRAYVSPRRVGCWTSERSSAARRSQAAAGRGRLEEPAEGDDPGRHDDVERGRAGLVRGLHRDGLDGHGLGPLEAQQPQRRRGAGREPRRRRAVGREPLDEGGHRYAPSSDQARAARRSARRVSRSTSPGWTP